MAAITVVLLEVALRFLGLTDPVLYEADAATGYRLRPNQHVTHLGNTIAINAWGIRDARDFEDPPCSDTHRILVLGDSVTWGGVELAQEELFTARLERKMRDDGHETAVLNAGVNGYSVAQMTALYETHLARLEPDRILVYAIPRDFLRPLKTELVRDSVVFPMRPPRWALSAAASLARIQSHRRLDWEWLAPAPVTQPRAGEYDESIALADNIAAYQRLHRITGGRSQLLLAPTRSGVSDVAVEQALQAANLPYTRVGDFLTPHDWEKRFADEVHLTRLGHEVVASAIAEILTAAAASPRADIVREEVLYTYVPPDNGSGPFWSFGCTTVARAEGAVFAVEMETGEDVPPLCNTRWRLHILDGDTWRLFAEAEGYRQREPAVLATTGPDSLYLYVNDSTEPPGTQYGPSEPHLLKFALGKPAEPVKLSPDWEGEPYFTDHSYRGFAADRATGQLLMLNIDARSSEQNWSLMTAEGETRGNGKIVFPIRSCYPQAALTNNAAYVLAIGDIREPVKEWAEYKFEQTQSQWDYVFRILYFTWTPDIRTRDFAEPIEIANVDNSAGHIMNQDLWVAPNQDAYILYTEREVASALMRDRFFPERSILDSLHLAIVRDGEVVSRKVLIEGTEERQPGAARFHVTASGEVYALLYAVIDGKPGNFLMPITAPPVERTLVTLPLEQPVSSFLLANTRAGNAPSDTIDLLGAGQGNTVRYVQISLSTIPES